MWAINETSRPLIPTSPVSPPARTPDRLPCPSNVEQPDHNC